MLTGPPIDQNIAFRRLLVMNDGDNRVRPGYNLDRSDEDRPISESTPSV